MSCEDDAAALGHSLQLGIMNMYAVADSVIKRNDEEGGMIEPGGGAADGLGLGLCFFVCHDCSLSHRR